MSENNINVNEENKIENGKMNLMGIDINISQVLGQKIVDQYITQLKDEDMEKIISYITSDLFTETDKFNYETGDYIKTTIVKKRTKDQWGHYREKEIPIGELIKDYFNNRIKDELKKKVEEIIASTDYQKRIDDIANELIEYSINGYKEDMKARIRERLVGNVLDAEPYYGEHSLHNIIHRAIDSRFQS